MNTKQFSSSVRSTPSSKSESELPKKSSTALPSIKPKRQKERPIEDNVVNYAATKYGRVALKMNVMSNRSWPDRAFFYPKGRVCWIEFKKPGETPNPNQVKKIRWLKLMGHEVAVIDNREEGRKVIDLWEKLCA